MKHIYPFLIFLLLSPCLSWSQMAPDFSFIDRQGNVHNLYDALDQGFIIVLDFFYVDCPPCQESAPELAAIHEDFSEQNVLIWSISDRDTNEEIASFNETFGLSHISGGIEGGGDEVIEMFDLNFTFIGFPTISVICPDHTIVWDIFPYSEGAPEWREAIETCGVTDMSKTYEPVGTTATFANEKKPDDYQTTLFPNPIQTQAILDISLKEETHLKIELMNLLGQSVSTLFEGKKMKGEQQIALIFENIPPSIYWIRIAYDGKKTKTIPIVKI